MEKTEGSSIDKLLTIIKGTFISIVITIGLFLIYGIVLSSTTISENTINPVIIVITGISILIGSEVACIKVKRKGMITGGVIGLVYIFTLYLISSILSKNFGVNIYTLIMFTCALVAGMIGGTIGINIKT